MGKPKRKRGNPNGHAITPLGPKTVSLAETPIKSPSTVVPAATSTPQATPKVDKPQLPTVSASQSLRQYTTTSQAQQFSGNQAGFLKVQYLVKVAEWAATTVPNLAAFYGQRLAAASEALAVPPPTTHSLCQRCETVLLVGENCSVRVTKAPKKWRKSKARGVDAGIKSALVYHCHFCKFRNKLPGTARGHVKAKLSQSSALSQMKILGNSGTGAVGLAEQTNSAGSHKTPAATPTTTPATSQSKSFVNKTPVATPQVGDVERVPAVSRPIGSPPSSPNAMAPSTGGGKKRKRKGWTTLKDMASAQLELPTPSRLGFMSPSNPSKQG